MGITVMPRLIDEPVQEDMLISIRSKSAKPIGIRPDVPKKVSEVIGDGKYYRHPDSLHVPYADVTQNLEALGTLPEGKDFNIAIVGGGASGIASLYELSKVARARKSGKIRVKVYEPDPNHFSFCSSEHGVCSLTGGTPVNFSTVDTKCKRAGRVFAARSRGAESKRDHAVYEIGAMRFPKIAGLTWKYVDAVFGKDAPIGVFPNPGKVPTEFVFGDRVDRYTAGKWDKKDSLTKKVSEWVADGLVGKGYGVDEKTNEHLDNINISMFKIAGKDPAKISEDLKSDQITPSKLEEIQRGWKEFVNKYDNLTLGSAVNMILREKLKNPLEIEGLEDYDEKLNYCVELFGCFGFGTGSFKPLFNMSILEMMRLILWSYSYEFTLPVRENVEFISGLYEKSICNNENLEVDFVRGRVCDVCHTGDGVGSKKALVFFYKKEVFFYGKEENRLLQNEHDYVILAVPPHQLSSITRRAGFSGRAHDVTIGDFARQADRAISVRPALMLSDKFEPVNVNIFAAINQLNLVGSSKIFGTIKADVFEKYAHEFKQEKIKAVVSDCGLGSSYIVPSSLHDKENPKYYSFLISYAWEDDTKRLQHKLKTYPISKRDKSEPKKHEEMITNIINHTVHDVKDPLDGEYKRWWFGQLMGNQGERHMTQTLSYDWNTSHASGAFKLDSAGGHFNTHLCFRYHTHALDGELDNRFFLAGDSYSHLGGWLEGAFMSSMNAVTGLIVAANGGGKKGVDALVPKARPIIEGLVPVVKERSVRNI